MKANVFYKISGISVIGMIIALFFMFILNQPYERYVGFVFGGFTVLFYVFMLLGLLKMYRDFEKEDSELNKNKPNKIKLLKDTFDEEDLHMFNKPKPLLKAGDIYVVKSMYETYYGVFYTINTPYGLYDVNVINCEIVE